MTEKIQISIPKEAREELDQYIKHLDMNRSRFFLIAAYKYFNELRKKEMREILAEGYLALAGESVEVVRSARMLQAKTLKDE